MTPLISGLYRGINRTIRKHQRVRCISIEDFHDMDEIEVEMEFNSIVIIFFKEFRIKKPMDGKRALQRLNALIRQYNYEILNLGKLDYFLLLPQDFEITTESLAL
ncbi:MAG: hypothetical protein EAX86_08740 [Candidatus Heimdallarchaeota archaeon]|nr:hypothetical protein [Candidatus Heimdallarchaeota archaeon]